VNEFLQVSEIQQAHLLVVVEWAVWLRLAHQWMYLSRLNRRLYFDGWACRHGPKGTEKAV
jgi:hypothetical protein